MICKIICLLLGHKYKHQWYGETWYGVHCSRCGKWEERRGDKPKT